jgi:hypothetical protein
VEKILKRWDKEGLEVKLDEADSKAKIQVDKSMTTLVLVKPLVRCRPRLALFLDVPASSPSRKDLTRRCSRAHHRAQGDVYVESFDSCGALGTVLVLLARRLAASGRIESVQRI